METIVLSPTEATVAVVLLSSALGASIGLAISYYIDRSLRKRRDKLLAETAIVMGMALNQRTTELEIKRGIPPQRAVDRAGLSVSEMVAAAVAHPVQSKESPFPPHIVEMASALLGKL